MASKHCNLSKAFEELWPKEIIQGREATQDLILYRASEQVVTAILTCANFECLFDGHAVKLHRRKWELQAVIDTIWTEWLQEKVGYSPCVRELHNNAGLHMGSLSDL